MAKVNLKWKNKFSGEEGYVKSVSYKNGYFENTFAKEEAKKYAGKKSLEKELAFLEAIGETVSNEFVIEEIRMLEPLPHA